jgi:glycosyltransferase involved in cell wall biosynthesis
MRILIATDAFPPVSGGSGWSTYELARALRARGHHLVIVQPWAERRPEPYDGFNVIGFQSSAPPVPFVRNYFRNERLYHRLGAFLRTLIREEHIDLVHGQHELTGPAVVAAARAEHIPSVVTVRDYWPLCYWSDLMQDPAGSVCAGCSARAMTRCLPPRVGAAWPLATPAIPYMRANLRRKQQALALADAIIAVSSPVSSYLHERSPLLAAARIECIPNGVDIARVRRLMQDVEPPMATPYAVFVGKLAANKGVAILADLLSEARISMPMVIIGSGAERTRLMNAAARSNRDVRVLDWLDRDEVFRWLAFSSMLIFPSNWPEPLSRVLLEASALGVPIAAMATGGTGDVIVDEESGLLSTSIEEFAGDIARLEAEPALRARLGSGAARRAQTCFDINTVTDRMVQLYEELASGSTAGAGRW